MCIHIYTYTLRKDVASTQQVLLPRHLHLNKQIIIGTIMTSGPGGLTSADVCLMKKLQRSIPHHVLVLLDIQPDKVRLYSIFMCMCKCIYNKHVYIYT